MHLFLQFDRDAFFRRRFACGPKKMRASSLGSHNIEIRRFDNVSEKHIIPWCVEIAKELLKDLHFVGTCLPGQTGILIGCEIGLCCGDGDRIATA